VINKKGPEMKKGLSLILLGMARLDKGKERKGQQGGFFVQTATFSLIHLGHA